MIFIKIHKHHVLIGQASTENSQRGTTNEQVAAEMGPHFGFLSGGLEQLVISHKPRECEEVD